MRRAGVKAVGVEEAVDAYYLHYRRPIFGGRAGNEVWARFVRLYVNSSYYSAVAPLCRLNHRASREAAVRLLRAFESYLLSLERRGRAWFGRGSQEAWVEAMRQLRRLFGDPADVSELHRVFKKLGEVLGRGRRGDPASLALSTASDPRRARLASLLAKAVDLSALLGDPLGDVGRVEGPGAEFEVAHGSFARVKRAVAYARALFVGALPVFLHKAASSTLPVRRPRARGDSGVFLLVDKSGSMYSAVGGVEKIALATAFALAVLKRYKRARLRFFDVEVHRVEELGDLVDVLSRAWAGGGTDISRAVEAAAEEAARERLRGYSLVVVTDGEDDAFSPAAAREARAVFREVLFVVVGERRLSGVRQVFLRPPPLAAAAPQAAYGFLANTGRGSTL